MTSPPELSRLRILLVEDNYLTRLGTVTLLRTQPDFELAGEAEDGAQALALARRLEPPADVAIVDLKLPGLDGVELVRLLGREARPPRVLVLTYYDGDETIFQALKAGALGYVTKGVLADELLAAVRAVGAGRRYLPTGIAERLADRMVQPALSPREREVLEHVARGLSNRDVAESLRVAERTVAMYVGKILEKLGAKNRTEAVAIALERGILPPR